MANPRARRVASAVCGALGLLLILVAVLLGYTRRSVFDERAFSARVSSSLRDPDVAGFAAQQIVDALIDAKPDLVGLRPILVGVAQNVVSSPPFRAAVRRSARALHHSITSGQAQEIVLTVKDVGAVFESVASTQPDLLAKLPKGAASTLGKLESLPGGERAAAIVRLANRARVLAWGLLVLGIALCAASVWLAAERRRVLVRIGIGLTFLALLLAVAARFGGPLLTLFLRNADLAPVVVGIARSFLGGLMIWAIGLGLTGLVLASAAASLLERVPLAEWTLGARLWMFGPQPRMRVRLARGLLIAVAGGALLQWPLASLTVVAWMTGMLAVFAGLREAFIAALHLLPALEPRARGSKAAARGTTPGFARAAAVVAGIALVLIGGTAWFVLRTPDVEAVAVGVTAYNGLPGLGERRLDEVVFPTTHNSMGSPDSPRWMFPNQSASIRQQLADGIRGFMLDVTYGIEAGDHVKTVMDSGSTSLAKYAAEVGPEGMEAAFRIRNRLTGKETGERDLYMCHGFCELGALPFVPVLREMRDFLVANPGEVLVLVIQDDGITAADLERAFDQSGLVDFVYTDSVGPPWPTLRHMVETDQRVVVFTENLREGIAWSHPAFDVIQETPYTFHTPADFTNKPNRGRPDGSLYLINHWIETTPMPKPSNAALVNARAALLARIEAFRKERKHMPNLVAVDFYQQGDLVAVCRELNAAP